MCSVHFIRLNVYVWYWVVHNLPQIYTANHATFPIQLRKLQYRFAVTSGSPSIWTYGTETFESSLGQCSCCPSISTFYLSLGLQLHFLTVICAGPCIKTCSILAIPGKLARNSPKWKRDWKSAKVKHDNHGNL